jgi:hypothetical protein
MYFGTWFAIKAFDRQQGFRQPAIDKQLLIFSINGTKDSEVIEQQFPLESEMQYVLS